MLDFLKNTLFDVRSPGEYEKGHIPGAISLPLFSDEERAIVGTTYKQQGREEAIEIGLDFVGPKLRHFVVETKRHTSKAGIYCWRGGMRSSSMKWLLETAGLQCCLLDGGYKRLNVAVTRSRFKTVVLSSISPEELDEDKINVDGVRYLKYYLDYAKNKDFNKFLQTTEGLDFDSGFEESVYETLVNEGFSVSTQVGNRKPLIN